MVLTWGLLGPGKGIEWGIAALGRLRDLPMPPRYVVAGQTHPKVLERDGEAYRDELRRVAADAGVADLVGLDPVHRNAAELQALITDADAVLLPYDSDEQVTSGVLVEALAAALPVIATDFPHAREMLGDGTGLIVPHRDPGAIADALRRLLTEPGLATSLALRSARVASALDWQTVAGRYRDLATAVADLPVGAAA